MPFSACCLAGRCRQLASTRDTVHLLTRALLSSGRELQLCGTHVVCLQAMQAALTQPLPPGPDTLQAMQAAHTAGVVAAAAKARAMAEQEEREMYRLVSYMPVCLGHKQCARSACCVCSACPQGRAAPEPSHMIMLALRHLRDVCACRFFVCEHR